jgi:hypothetical protein
MNLDGAKQATKAYIRASEITLLSGLSTQGVNREIRQLTTSIAPPRDYYWIGIECESARSFSMPARNVVKPPEWVKYGMVIHVSDYAIFQAGDDEPYETMHSQFDLLCSRIVKLVRPQTPGTTWIPSASSAPKFRLVIDHYETDQVVTVDNLCLLGEHTAGLAAMLYSSIRFELFECADLSLI